MRQRGVRGSLAGLAALLLVAPACREPDEVLIPGRSWVRTLAGGETLAYRLSLAAGDVVEVEVAQQGVDVAASLVDPDGRRLVEVDGWLGSLGVERVLWLAERPGRYRLEIRSLDAAADPGSLTVRAEKPRPASERDRRRTAAAEAFYGARRAESDGRVDEARAGFERSARLWRELAEAPWLAEVAHARGHLELFQGRLEAAFEAYAEALAHAGDDTAMRARTYVSIGDVHRLRSRIERAREAYQQALELFARTPDRGGEALAANNLGWAHKQLREVGEALRHYRRALELWRELGDREALATALHNLGWAYAYQGKTARAGEHFRQALAVRQAEAARQRSAGDEPQEETRFSMARTLGGLERSRLTAC